MPIPVAQVIGFERVQIIHITDDRGFHRRQGKAVQIHLFPQFAVRRVFRALAAFFADDVHFIEKFFIAEIEVVHAVGFEFQHFGQVFRRDILVINRLAAVGIGVVLSAQSCHASAEFA